MIIIIMIIIVLIVSCVCEILPANGMLQWYLSHEHAYY